MTLFKAPFLIVLSLILISSCNPLGESTQEVAPQYCPGINQKLFDSNCNPIVTAPKEDIILTKSWDFSIASEYTYPTDKIQISDNKASLIPVSLKADENNFTSGTLTTTSVTNSKLTVKTANHSDYDIRSIVPDFNSNLKGYIKFEGNFNDQSSVLTPSSTSPPTYVPGFLGQSGHFDGTQYIGLEDSADDYANYTVSLWFYVDDSNDTGINIFHRGNGGSCNYSPILVYVYSSSQFRARESGCANSGSFAANRIEISQWNHIVVTQSNSTEQKYYLNGELITTGNIDSTDMFTNKKAILGGSVSGAGAYAPDFKGLIDEFAFWDTTLDQEAVSKIYNAQRSLSAEKKSLNSDWTPQWSEVIAYWSMDGNWRDQSGKGNHMTPNGSLTRTSDAQVGSASALLDGTDDYFEVAHSSDFEFTDFTLCTWIKKTGTNYNRFMSKDGSWVLGVTNTANNSVLFWKHDKTVNSLTNTTTTIPLYSWSHICMIRDTENDLLSLYLNGQVIHSQASTDNSIESNTSNISLGNNLVGSSEFWNGQIDESAIWKTALKAKEINSLYQRQKQKFYGVYESPIFEVGKSIDWTGISPTTPLPFGKDLVGTAIETTASYPSLLSNLSENLVLHLTFDESSKGTAPGGADFADSSSQEAHATFSSTNEIIEKGILGNSIFNSQVVVSNNPPLFHGTQPFTVSAWFNSASKTSWYDLLGTNKLDGNGKWQGWWCNIYNSNTEQLQCTRTINDVRRWVTSNGTVNDGKWHHFIFQYTGTQSKLYLDGILEDTIDDDRSIPSSTTNLSIGEGGSVEGKIDEVAIWDRVLTETEILELYRRGANRIFYQVRTCATPDCSDSSYQGPGGDDSTFYHELMNRPTSGIEFNCGSDNICSPEEISLTGVANEGSPEFLFAEMAPEAVLASQRYFQFKAVLESEGNTACSNENCFPEITNVQIQPQTKYYFGVHTLSANTSFSYSKIKSMSFEEEGNCALTYQLSPNGSDYYYWNGSQWSKASGANQNEASSATIITNQISSFVSTVGTGQLIFKAFMDTDSDQSCSLAKITLQLVN